MSTTIPEADLIIVWGPRSVLSLVGIVVLVAGVWYTDRAWDEKGSVAYNRAKTLLLQEKQNSAEQEVTIPPKELDEAFPFPIAFLVGWVLFGLAYFFPVDGSTTFSVNKDSVPPFVVSVALSIIASVPMGHAVRYRNAQRKTVLGMLFVASWVLLTALSGSEFGVLSYILRAIGAASIVASMKILWKHRKMGDWWEQEGRPNPNPVVYNIGGPLFVMGWFLFWVGMTATKPKGIPNEHYLPIYLTVRSLLAFVAGCGMVPVVLFLDYAHDEGAEFTGFGTDGRYFGWFEKPWAFLISWTLFGFASWLPLDSNGVSGVTILQWVILINCSLQGFGKGELHFAIPHCSTHKSHSDAIALSFV